MVLIPDDLEAQLNRHDTAAALTAAGYQTAPTTLATLACRGAGPPFRKYGRWLLYTWGDALAWARSRTTPLVRSTSELDTAQKASLNDVRGHS